MNKKFSVLMSVYYKENPDYLSAALDSIFSQTVMPNEVVLVEDGKLTKELDKVISKYSKKYSKILKIVKFEKNRGLGAALNDGLNYCKYEYVARMDSDDVSVLDRFEKQINYIVKHPEYDLIGGNIMEFDNITGKEMKSRVVPNKREDILKCIKRRNPFNHVTVMFRKTSVIEVGGYESCPFFEDYYLWARMIYYNKHVNNINETLVKVRAGLEMSERRGDLKYIKHIIDFEKKLKNMKIINSYEMITNIIIRSIVALMPNRIRNNFYQRNLRE